VLLYTLFIVINISIAGKVIQDASSSLRTRYDRSRFILRDEWLPYKPKGYAKLAFIHHKDKHVETSVISATSQLRSY